ncbi:hypothetical protein [Salinisphaera sp. T31B1]|uniref:hypothetical protein n=1 Tax=Salinisphaera sp. T31B1 TaxID=727963 RepID=UPI00333E3AA0
MSDSTTFEQVDAPRRWLWRRLMAFACLAVILVVAVFALLHPIPEGNTGVVTTIIWVCAGVIGMYYGNNTWTEHVALRSQK